MINRLINVIKFTRILFVRNWIFCFLIIFCSTNAWSQDYYFKKYQVENGLSHNTITSTIQDHLGFLWFGTKDGLNRFDGYSFRVFHNAANDKNSIGSNFVRCLHEDKNNLWVGTDNGLYKYNEEKENFTLAVNSANTPILDIESNEKGMLWFIAAGKLHRINSQSDEGASKNSLIPSSEYLLWLSKTSDGVLWVASENKLFQYSEKQNNLVEIQIATTIPAFKPIITALQAGNNNSLFIGTKFDGALQIDIKTKKATQILPNVKPVFIRSIIQNEAGAIWIGSESGLYIQNLKDNTWINLKKNHGDRYALSDNAIYSLTQDKEGGIWIGTYFGGVNYYPYPYTPFKRYFPSSDVNSISGNAVRQIKKDSFGMLWIGTEDAGLNRFNPKTQQFSHFRSGSNQKDFFYHNIHGLLPKGDQLWIGTFEHGLELMNIKSGKITNHYGALPVSGGLESDFVIDIFESSTKDLYALTSSGVNIYDAKKDHFSSFNAFPNKLHYTYMAEDKKGKLWVGTYWDGLYYYNPLNGQKGVFKHKINDTTSISSNVINGIFIDSRKKLWVTTENGLNLFNESKNNFTRFSKKDGLPSNVVYSILEDDKKHLWISTSGGIVDYNPEKNIFKTYTTADGLLSNQFNYSSAFKDLDGTMYFGSFYGMIQFNPNMFVANTYNAPIRFTDISINNSSFPRNDEKSPLQKSITFLDKLELTYNQSSFGLEFAKLLYTAPETIEYWFKLDGLYEEWIPLKNNHKVFFTDLPRGDYIFKVRTKNNQGVWNDDTLSLEISILPPFWLSVWAYIFYFLLLLGLLYFGVKFYHSRLKEKNNRRFVKFQDKKEKEVLQAKIEFFTNVAHEIRTPLTLIKNPIKKLLKQKDQPLDTQESLTIVDKNTTRLLNLVNQLLDFRKAEAEEMKLTFVKTGIVELLKDIIVQFKSLIDKKELNFTMDVESEEIPVYVDPEAVNKILSNLIHNAIKYSDSKVWLTLKEENENIIFKISNDGELIPSQLKERIFEPFFRISENKKNSGTGIGLSLARSLAELHKGSLIFSSQIPNKNTFVLSLPINQEEAFIIKPDNSYSTNATEMNDTFPAILISQTINPTILIAEDDLDLMDFLEKELKNSFTILKALDGEKALEIVLKEHIQLVVSDVKMPKMNGFDLCKSIKNNTDTCHIPVILLTSKTGSKSKIKGLQSKADVYIPKPFSIDVLTLQINNLLENRKQILQYYLSSPLSNLKANSNSQVDASFLHELDKAMSNNIADPDLSIETLAEIMNMSRSTFYRKLKDLSDLSPNDLINRSRLMKAAELLHTGKYKIFEVAEMVGYKSQTNFGRNFHKFYKMTPTEYIQNSKGQ